MADIPFLRVVTDVQGSESFGLGACTLMGLTAVSLPKSRLAWL